MAALFFDAGFLTAARLPDEADLRAPPFFAAPARAFPDLRALDFRAVRAADFRAGFFAALRDALRVFFLPAAAFFFLATVAPPSARDPIIQFHVWCRSARRARPNAMECNAPFQQIAPEPSRGPQDRVVISTEPGALRLEIRPLVRTVRGRRRLTIAAIVLLASALFGAARLGQLWEIGLKRGDFSDFPLPLLAALTVAVGLFSPLAFLGLAALAFSEETVEVRPDSVTITTTTFERTRVRTIPLDEVECWRETYLPLPPWWTWAVERLAVRRAGKLEPLAGAAGPREKRMIAEVLSRATGRPLINDFGRVR